VKDFLGDGRAMQIVIGQSQENLEPMRREWRGVSLHVTVFGQYIPTTIYMEIDEIWPRLVGRGLEGA